MNVNDDLDKLIETIPFFLQEHLNNHAKRDKLVEIVLDLGRRPEARFINGTEYLSQKLISWQDIDYITKQISKFSSIFITKFTNLFGYIIYILPGD